jgi:cytochrome d ubiquinol oxidase subunit II
MDLNVIWYLLIGLLITGYAVLDGFDLGVGVLYPFIAKNEEERRVLLNAIGPFWDGNEVWLITGGGALFAAFPHVYATVFSGFYLAMMLVLFALIFRAVSLEFRKGSQWRGFWDGAFVVGSFLPALLYGVAIGNLARGVPLDAKMNFTGTFFTLLNPYALLIGLLGLAMFVMQGAAYVVLKTEGELPERARRWRQKAWLAFVILFVVVTVTAVFVRPEGFSRPLAWLAWLVVVASAVYGRVAAGHKKELLAFLASSAAIAGLMGILAASNFPNMVPASNDPALSLTIYNASSSAKTLTVMLIMALVGMPIVIAYTAFIYYIFKGKVKLTEEGY